MDHQTVQAIADRHGVILLLQFGSTVTGRVHPRSDVDIGALLGRPMPSFEEYASLQHDLQGLFPGREVDLVLLDHADPLLLKKVTESCRLLSGEPRRLHELKIYAFKRYQDHRRYLALERAFVSRHAASSSVP